MFKLEKDLKRPWGGFIKFIDNKRCTVKILRFKNGGSLSLQSHKLREEFWYIISGKAKIILGRSQTSLKTRILKENQFVLIPRKYLHRAEGIGSCQILEISTGTFKENDEIRYWDKYGRKNPK